MQIKKSQLKQLIKECLVEILSEGIGPALTESIQRNQASIPSRAVQKKVAAEPRKNNSQIVKQVLERPDPIVESILNDTAARSLPEMLDAEKNGGVRDQTGGVSPEDLFGESSSKWLNILDRIEN